MSDYTQTNADWYFAKTDDKWQLAKIALRNISLECNLTEGLTYGKPTYYTNGDKIFLIHTFKGYTAILFFKGSLMADPDKILIQQTENVQAGRQLRFVSVDQIKKMKSTITQYIQESIRVEESGAQVVFKKTNQFDFPEEFQIALDKSDDLTTAFYNLTPGRQRGYLLYFNSAKQTKTRIERIQTSTPYILKGKGRLKGSGFED
jgi:uncharacterized protein YdeI (YjbR/CyaY-like superfamily)